MKILAINPGATSTKMGLYDDDKEIFSQSIPHYKEDIHKFEKTSDQLDMRIELITSFLKEKEINIKDIDIFVARGGPFKSMESGTYMINEQMIKDVLNGNVLADHVSNLGCLIANQLGGNRPKYIVDPVSVDEFEDVARISGLNLIERKSLSHALNMKMVAKRWAKTNHLDYNKINLIIAHLGTGISVSAHKKGKMVDINNANDEGPFSPQRAAGLPSTQLIKLCYSDKYSLQEMKTMLTKKGGMYSYLGTDSVPEAIEKMLAGDAHAKLILNAMMYQVSKYIGAMACVLNGKVDSIIITGGIAYNEVLNDMIKEKTEFIAPISIYPGEDEIYALVMGVLRILNNEEKVMDY